MSKLSKEQIERLREALLISWVNTPQSANTLCDMALASIEGAEDAGRLNWLANNAYAEQVEFDSWYLAIGWEQKQWDHNPGTVTQKMFKAAIDQAMKGSSHE